MPPPRLFFLLLPQAVLFPISATAAGDDDAPTTQYAISAFLDSRSFDHGTFSIFASWVALISICIGQYRQAVDLHDSYWNQTEERIVQARLAIFRGALEAIVIFSVLMIGLAILVPLSTKNLDDRMAIIIQGFSMILNSFILAILSIRVGIWLNLYGHPFWKPDSAILNKRLGTTVVELKHRVRWSVSKIILRTFFLLLVVFQGVNAATIPISILLGLLFGVGVDVGIATSRRWKSLWCKNCVGICFVIALQSLTLSVFSWGVFFIAAVWESNLDDDVAITWDIYASLAGVVILPLLHVLVWFLGRRHSKFLLQQEQQQADESGENGGIDTSTRNRSRARMATSMYFSDRNIMKKVKEQEKAEAQQQSENFETTQSKQRITEEHVASEAQQKMVTEVDDDGGESSDDEELDDDAYNPIPNEAIQATSTNTDTEQVEPTFWSLMMDWQCCGCARGDDKTTFHKVMKVIFWIGYLIMCAMCVFTFVVNVGATFQQDASREELPFVADVLYTGMDEGPVCAYDAALGKEGSNPTTFTDKDAAHAANFSILHCGACNHCSDWHNLELEYTTRKFLAQEGKNCAQKYLFGGGYDALVECLEDPARIGWQGTCAICWADDIICTSDHCAMIGIQSFFINTLSNFEVGEDTITAASCEEAFCEADNPVKQAPEATSWYGLFVECSGANRRRMNVTSSIARPGDQQCSIVDVDWDELFPNLHPNDPDYKAS